MKSILLVFFACTMLIACSENNESGSKGNVNLAHVSDVENGLETNPIVGTWVYIYPSIRCAETYIFNADGTFVESSLEEIQKGVYTLENTAAAGTRHLLSISVTSDNRMKDCNGLSKDATGISRNLYVNFPSMAAMEWFDTAEGGEILAHLKK